MPSAQFSWSSSHPATLFMYVFLDFSNPMLGVSRHLSSPGSSMAEFQSTPCLCIKVRGPIAFTATSNSNFGCWIRSGIGLSSYQLQNRGDCHFKFHHFVVGYAKAIRGQCDDSFLFKWWCRPSLLRSLLCFTLEKEIWIIFYFLNYESELYLKQPLTPPKCKTFVAYDTSNH